VVIGQVVSIGVEFADASAAFEGPVVPQRVVRGAFQEERLSGDEVGPVVGESVVAAAFDEVSFGAVLGDVSFEDVSL